MLSFSVLLYVFFSAFFVVEGTLTPDGTVPLDCVSQQTFTCSVTGPSAGWTISGLSGMSVTRENGLLAANNNARITTTDTMGITPSSTITITGFTTSDDRGAIQCIDLNDGSVQGMANISVESPSCPTNFSANRDGDFASATVTYQLATPPPVTSTTVTYCLTSSLNCGNSMNCTTSPCTISGLDPCMEYNLSAFPNNNCGSATGCNSTVVASQGLPSCAENITLLNGTSKTCSVKVMWQQPPNTPPVTFTTVTYCPTSDSSPNCEDNMNCTSPCTISGLDPGTEYQFTVTPNNICGSAELCTSRNNATAKTPSDCHSEKSTDPTTTTLPVAAIAGGVVGGSAGVALGALGTYAIAVLIAVLCCSSCEGRSYCHVFFCQCCCGGEPKRPSSTRPMPADEYADPKKVREKKEKEEKIQYAALEFSEQAGSSGEKPIRSKEEPVQYLSVEQA